MENLIKNWQRKTQKTNKKKTIATFTTS